MQDICEVLERYHGENIKVVDLHDSLWKEMIIVNCKNKRHIHAMADHVTQYLKKEKKILPKMEGKSEQNEDWVVLDADSTLIHLFSSAARSFYDLEGIWSNNSGS